jgi:hypothetical protein
MFMYAEDQFVSKTSWVAYLCSFHPHISAMIPKQYPTSSSLISYLDTSVPVICRLSHYHFYLLIILVQQSSKFNGVSLKEMKEFQKQEFLFEIHRSHVRSAQILVPIDQPI